MLTAFAALLLAGCAGLTAPSTMSSDLDRCSRYGGSAFDGMC